MRQDIRKGWKKSIRELSKKSGWRLCQDFLFKNEGDLFFRCDFGLNTSENLISGKLMYKTMSVDTKFWRIIQNDVSSMPLSFRGKGVFCVKPVIIFDLKIPIENELAPESEMLEFMRTINIKVVDKLNEIQTLSDFRNDLFADEWRHDIGLITAYIEDKNYQLAMDKIDEYRAKGRTSGFIFGKHDFYDLAENYCKTEGGDIGRRALAGNFVESIIWGADNFVEHHSTLFPGLDFSMESLAIFEEVLNEAEETYFQWEDKLKWKVTNEAASYWYEVIRKRYGGDYFLDEVSNGAILIIGNPDFEFGFRAFPILKRRLDLDDKVSLASYLEKLHRAIDTKNSIQLE